MLTSFFSCTSENHKRAINVIDSHTEGEPARIVLSGVPELFGDTVAKKRDYFKENYDDIRKFLLYEPRGHNAMFGAIITEPCNENADIGVFFLETAGYLNMCGHASIAVVTALLNCNMLRKTSPVTEVKLDTPAGIVTAWANIENGEVKDVTIKNVPSFLYKEDLNIEIEGKEYTVDISFGGSFFALIDSEQINLSIDRDNITEFLNLGMKILEAVNSKIKVQHPLLKHINTVDLVEFYYANPKDERKIAISAKNIVVSAKNIVVFGNKQFDRSPCGTGTSAKIAMLVAKKRLELNEDFIYESIISTKFKGRAIGIVKVGEYDAIIPTITGNAYITGFQSLIEEKNDPFKIGFNIV